MDYIVIHLFRLCLLVSVLISFYGLGALAFDRFIFKSGFSSLRVFTSITIGIAFISYLTLILGLSNLLYDRIIYFSLAIFFICGLYKLNNLITYELKDYWNQLCSNLKSLDFFSRVSLVIIFVLLIINLFGASLAPIGIDDIKYHFAIPKRYLNDNAINFYGDIEFSNFPFPIEMIWTLAISIDSTAVLAQQLNFVFGLLVLGWIYLISKKADLDLSTIILSICLFYSISSVGYQSRSGSVELGGALFFLAGIYYLNLFLKKNSYKSLIISGAFLGFFSVVKLSNPVVVILMTPWLIFELNKSKKSLLQSFGCGILFSGTAFICASIWYLKSYFFTGNPFYPFLQSTFGGPYLNYNLLSGETYSPDQSFQHIYEAPMRFFTQLWYLISDPQKIRGHVSPLYLFSLPIIINVYKNQKKIIKKIIIISLLFYIYWISFYPSVRIGLPLFALFSIPVSISLNSFKETKSIFKAAYLFLFLFCSLSIANNLKIAVQNYSLITGINNNVKFISDSERIYHSKSIDAIDWINNNTSDNCKILFWPNNGFYLNRDYLYAIGFVTTMANPDNIYDFKKVIKELQNFGITHVAMTDNHLRLKLKNTIINSGGINVMYEDDNMIVASLK